MSRKVTFGVSYAKQLQLLMRKRKTAMTFSIRSHKKVDERNKTFVLNYAQEERHELIYKMTTKIMSNIYLNRTPKPNICSFSSSIVIVRSK